MSKAMVRKQVYLTADLDARLRRAAAVERRSEAEILREALAIRLDVKGAARVDEAADTLWNLVGVAESSAGNLSEQVDEVLYGKSASQR